MKNKPKQTTTKISTCAGKDSMKNKPKQTTTKISTCAKKDSMQNRPKQTTTNKNINFIIRLYERYRMRLVFSIGFV